MTTTRPHGPDCCEVTDPPAFLDPVRDELDRLRTQLAQICENYGTDFAEWTRRNEQAEARVEALTQELATVRDTLRHRSNALNATGTHNDKLRATLTRISTELMALEPRAKDFATRSSLLMLSRFADHALLEALADKEPTP